MSKKHLRQQPRPAGKRSAVAKEVPYTRGPMRAGEYALMYLNGVLHGMWHGCPCDCGLRSYLPLEGDESWKIVKPFPKATLSPSIGMFKGQNPYHWHGYLEDGVFVER